jgi:hypothetical protein
MLFPVFPAISRSRTKSGFCSRTQGIPRSPTTAQWEIVVVKPRKNGCIYNSGSALWGSFRPGITKAKERVGFNPAHTLNRANFANEDRVFIKVHPSDVSLNGQITRPYRADTCRQTHDRANGTPKEPEKLASFHFGLVGINGLRHPV